MPSGVSQGAAAPAGVAAAVDSTSANWTCAKFGMRLMRSPDLFSKNIVRGLECRQGVAALVDERFYPCRPQGGLTATRAAGEIEVPHSRRLERFGRSNCLPLIDAVGRAQAGQRK